MYPRINRLRLKKDFQRVFEKGRNFYTPYAGVKIAENGLLFPRFGVVVSLKVSKRATVRNRVKRRIREILRLSLPCFKKNGDIVIIAKPGIQEVSYQKLKQTISGLLAKARVL